MSLRPRGLFSDTASCNNFYSDKLSTQVIYELNLLNIDVLPSPSWSLRLSEQRQELRPLNLPCCAAQQVGSS